MRTHRLTNLRRARPRVEMRRRAHEARVLWRWRHLPRQLRWCRSGLCLFAQAVAEADFQGAPNGLAQLFTCVLEHRITQLHPVCVQSTINGVSSAVAEGELGFLRRWGFWQGKAATPRWRRTSQAIKPQLIQRCHHVIYRNVRQLHVVLEDLAQRARGGHQLHTTPGGAPSSGY